MNTVGKHISTAFSILILFALLMGIIYLFQPSSNSPLAAGTTEMPVGGYPVAARTTEIPMNGYPAPNTPIDPTQLATLMAYVTQEVITIEDLTPLWFTPEPTSTATPSIKGSLVQDFLNNFSLNLPKGWYSYTPSNDVISGVTTITNYDLNALEHRPPNGVVIHIGSTRLNNGQSFDEWILDWRKLNTASESGATGFTLTETKPLTLGSYTGVGFIARQLLGEGLMMICLRVTNDKVLIIDVSPMESLAYPEAISLLTTIKDNDLVLP